MGKRDEDWKKKCMEFIELKANDRLEDHEGHGWRVWTSTKKISMTERDGGGMKRKSNPIGKWTINR